MHSIIQRVCETLADGDEVTRTIGEVDRREQLLVELGTHDIDRHLADWESEERRTAIARIDELEQQLGWIP